MGTKTERVQQAPGGTSSFTLRHDMGEVVKESVSANAFAHGSNQNSGNVITNRSSTRVRHAPGGQSSIRLGDENTNTSNLPQSHEVKPVKGALAKMFQEADARTIESSPVILG